jgi:predicted DCC family thiol-disulfide oxidoreductase YuxK
MSDENMAAEKPRSRQNAVPVSGVPDGTVLYDGVCVLCSTWFRFVAARDPAARFRFTPIQGDYGRGLAVHLGIDPDNPETNAVIIAGCAYLRSDAAIQILRRLPGWSWAALLLVVPRPARDWVYNAVARNRYRLFGRTETCMVPDQELARHMLPETASL